MKEDFKAYKLDPKAVRERAKGVSGCRPVESASVSVCSFLVGCVPVSDSPDTENVNVVEQLARINVFCETGTVGTCRVLQGSVRQTFRRQVSSLDGVERLLRFPPALTLIDDRLVSFTDNTNNETSSASQRLKSHQGKVELADVGAAILQNEKDKLVRHLQALVELAEKEPPSRPSDHSEATAEASQHTMTAGMEFQFSLPQRSMKHVDQCLSDVSFTFGAKVALQQKFLSVAVASA